MGQDGLTEVADAAEGLALEHELFCGAGPLVAMWRAQADGLVCPSAYDRRDGFAAGCAASATRGWPVVTRPTGGGTVPQGPGVVNLVMAFNAPADASIEDCYRMLTDVIRGGFGAHGARMVAGDTPGSFCDGAWNLSVDGQKIVGTAQRWRPKRGAAPRGFTLALILVDNSFDAGARAVDGFHGDLDLGPVVPQAHTSVRAAFGMAEAPVAALCQQAEAALATFHAA